MIAELDPELARRAAYLDRADPASQKPSEGQRAEPDRRS